MQNPRRGQFDAVVSLNQPLCREHFKLTLTMPFFPATAPGQFVQLQCVDDTLLTHEAREFDWPPFDLPQNDIEREARVAVLRRPFSLAGRRDIDNGTKKSVELDIIARTVGVGTDWMSRVKVGDRISVIGPLGNAYTLPPEKGIALMVGGGVGVPPMIYLAEALANAGRRGIVFCGAMTRDLLALTITDNAPAPGATSIDPLYNIAEFDRHGIPAVITTDDGSYGYKGYVTQALEKYLDAFITDNADRARAVIYTCGPEGMMKHAASIAMKRNIACQVCVERAMACGMGTCQSCCIKVLKPDPALPPLAGSDWCYRLACTDGPVFEARTLVW